MQIAPYPHHSLRLPYHSYLPHTSLIKSQSFISTYKPTHTFTPAHSLSPSPPPVLHSFTPATLLEIGNLLSQSSDSYCDLDPVPTTVLKKISNAISPSILLIVNLSITNGTFPSTLKSSIISPLLKKPSLNKEDLSNYRHIANLSFISKLTEKIVKKAPSWPFNLQLFAQPLSIFLYQILLHRDYITFPTWPSF